MVTLAQYRNSGTNVPDQPYTPAKRRAIINAHNMAAKYQKKLKEQRKISDDANALRAYQNLYEKAVPFIWKDPGNAAYKKALREELAYRTIRGYFRRGANKLKEGHWLRGLEREKARAISNFEGFNKLYKGFIKSPAAFYVSPPKSNPRTPNRSPSKSPKGLTPRSPATLAREKRLGIAGGAKSHVRGQPKTAITWTRNKKGRVTTYKTLSEVATNAQGWRTDKKIRKELQSLARRN